MKIELDKKKATEIANNLLAPFNGISVEHSMTVLNGMTFALLRYAVAVKGLVSSDMEDALERMILQWIKNADNITNMNFGRYIDVDPESHWQYDKLKWNDPKDIFPEYDRDVLVKIDNMPFNKYEVCRYTSEGFVVKSPVWYGGWCNADFSIAAWRYIYD